MRLRFFSSYIQSHVAIRAQSKDRGRRHPLIDAVSPNAAARQSPIIIWGTENDGYYWYLLTASGTLLPGQVLYKNLASFHPAVILEDGWGEAWVGLGGVGTYIVRQAWGSERRMNVHARDQMGGCRGLAMGYRL
jgi:hypothetical protein